MNEELYWRAQWIIGLLEEKRHKKTLYGIEEDVLDIMLAV